jgi:hypothetical protein
MPPGDLITRNVQVELPRGLLVGAETDYQLTGPIDGIGNLEVRATDLNRPLDHGLYAGRPLYGGRAIRIPLAIFATSQADAMAKLEVLGSSARVPIASIDGDDEELELVFRLGDLRLTALGQPRRMAVDLSLLTKSPPTIEAVVEFLATDPRLYGDERNDTATPGSITGGLELPHDFPHGFGTATPGTLQAPNDGNFPTYPTAVVTAGVGGTSGFSIEKVSTGETLSVTLAMNAGDELELNFRDRSATLNGQASRTNAIDRPGSTWFTLDPGANAIGFAVLSGDATLDFTWRDAYVFG